MIIRPSENQDIDDIDILSNVERNIIKSHREFHIFDEVQSPASYNYENRLFSGVIQVNKLLVKGMPDDPYCVYDKPKEERTTFVKYIYIYNAFMNANIIDVNERFQKAILRPIVGMVSAYTDTKKIIYDSMNTFGIKVNNQFGISIYNFENKSIMNILCNPTMVKDGLITGTDRLDIVDPRYNIVKYLDSTNSSDSTSIPSHFEGRDLIRSIKETDINVYESFYKDHNSFTEDALLNFSQKINRGNKFRFNREAEAGGLITVPQNDTTRRITQFIDRKRALQSFLIDITKASAYSLFESFTMMYETGKNPTFKVITPPFGQIVIDYMQEKMLYVYNEFNKLSENITEIFGNVRILLHINDVEHVIRCVFLNKNNNDEDRTITLRMTKMECINGYILESLYGKTGRGSLLNFKEEHEMDLLNYYSYNENGTNFTFNGTL
jgi:hypothetical protein